MSLSIEVRPPAQEQFNSSEHLSDAEVRQVAWQLSAEAARREADEADAREHVRRVGQRVRDLRVDQEARQQFREEGRAPMPLIVRASQLMQLARPATACLVEDLWPENGRVVLSAPHKVGKTTLALDIIRCLADGDPFLQAFAVRPVERVVLLDAEMDPNRLGEWLRRANPTRSDAIDVLAVRGHLGSLDLLGATSRRDLAAQLGQADVLVVDCLRPLLDSHGLDENHDAGRLLAAIDELVVQAGIPNVLVIHHAGHGSVRARGDSRIQDWPDALWTLQSRSEDSRRVLSAYGRDVPRRQYELGFDSRTQSYVATGAGRDGAARVDAIEGATLEAIELSPGITVTALREAVARPLRVQNGQVDRAALRLAEKGLIRRDVTGRGTKHYPAGPRIGSQR